MISARIDPAFPPAAIDGSSARQHIPERMDELRRLAEEWAAAEKFAEQANPRTSRTRQTKPIVASRTMHHAKTAPDANSGESPLSTAHSMATIKSAEPLSGPATSSSGQIRRARSSAKLIQNIPHHMLISSLTSPPKIASIS